MDAESHVQTSEEQCQRLTVGGGTMLQSEDTVHHTDFPLPVYLGPTC